MKYVIFVGSVLLLVGLFTPLYAEQDINHVCKSDCLAKGGNLASCNATCSTSNTSGDCLSSCMSRSGVTAYSCYQECGKTNPSGSNSGSSPETSEPRSSGANY